VTWRSAALLDGGAHLRRSHGSPGYPPLARGLAQGAGAETRQERSDGRQAGLAPGDDTQGELDAAQLLAAFLRVWGGVRLWTPLPQQCG